MSRATILAAAVLAAAGTCAGQARRAGATPRPFAAPVATAGGIEVYFKADFEKANPFVKAGEGRVGLDDADGVVLGEKSLLVGHLGPEGYFGAGAKLEAAGSKGLKIAFCVRAEKLRSVTVNFRDTVKDDNTTARSPALIDGRAGWMPVVFHVEDFRYNAGGSEAIDAEARFVHLMVHAAETEAGAGAFHLDNVVVYRGRDTAPPTAPASLKIAPGENGRVELSWRPAKDNAAPAVYSVHRRRMGRWVKVGETSGTRYVDVVPATGLQAYRVTAADYDHNVGPPAVAMPVTVRSAGPKPAPPAAPVADRLRYAANVRRVHQAGLRRARPDVAVFFGDQHLHPWAAFRTRAGTLARVLPVERGSPGKTTAFAKGRIAEVLREDRPQFVVVQFGSSDEKDPRALAAAMANLAAVVDACLRAGSLPVLCTIPPRGDADEAPQKRFNRGLIELARRKQVPVSYGFEALTAEGAGEVIGPSGLLTPAGNAAAAHALRETFDQIFFAIRDASRRLR